MEVSWASTMPPELFQPRCRLCVITSSVFSGGYPFAAFTILDQTQSDLHQDTNNDPETWNLIIPLTVFQGGGVWYEAESGPVPCPLDPQRSGYVLNVSEGPSVASCSYCHLEQMWFPLAKSSANS